MGKGWRYKKWSELTFWERLGRDKYAYEKTRKRLEDEESNRKCCECIMALIKFAFALLLLLCLFAPYYFVYIGYWIKDEYIMYSNIASSTVYTLIIIAVFCPGCCDCASACCFATFFCLTNTFTIACDGFCIYKFWYEFKESDDFRENKYVNLGIASFNIIYCLLFFIIICRMYSIKKKFELEEIDVKTIPEEKIVDDDTKA